MFIQDLDHIKNLEDNQDHDYLVNGGRKYFSSQIQARSYARVEASGNKKSYGFTFSTAITGAGKFEF